jgi:uncharacterized BrkB/YihY/UPF0761 family membrane protein
MANIVRVGLTSISSARLAQLARAAYHSYRRTNCAQMAAGLALFSMLSLMPLVALMLSSVAPLVQAISPGFEIRRAILHFAQITVSPVARLWLQDVVQSITSNTAVTNAFTFLVFAWAALNTFSQLDASFQRIWHDSDVVTVSGLRQIVWEQIWRRRNALVLLVLVVAGFVGTSLVGRWAADWEASLAREFSIEQVAITSIVAWFESGLFLALLYRWLLPKPARWRSILIGAIIASGANLVVRALVATFVDTTIGATNSAIGGPLSLMLGVFLFSQNVLIGCILVHQSTRVYA